VKKNRKKTIEFEEVRGHLFADLGLSDADELYVRAQIGFGVYRILKAKGLKQREIAELLGVPHPEVLSSDERPFQPLHYPQASRFSQAFGPKK
jgi:predicted XRE-type DNA-binding protein